MGGRNCWIGEEVWMGTNIWKQRSHYGLLKSSPALPNMGFIFHAQRAPSQRYQPTKLLWKTRTATINGLFKTGAWKKGRIRFMCLSTFSYKYSLLKTKMLSSYGIVTDWTMMWSAVQYYKLDNGFVLFSITLSPDTITSQLREF